MIPTIKPSPQTKKKRMGQELITYSNDGIGVLTISGDTEHDQLSVPPIIQHDPVNL